MIIDVSDDENFLAHYGILRKSGRYPWGSGGSVDVRSRTFLDHIAELRKAGMKDTEIAKSFSDDNHPFTTSDLRNLTTIARAAKKQYDISHAYNLKFVKGMSTSAVATEMGLNESSVRALLAPGAADRANALHSITEKLKSEVEAKDIVDIGVGVENWLGVTKDKMAVAVAMLREQGYTTHRFKNPQAATGHNTDYKVLAKPGMTQKDVWLRRNEVQLPFGRSEDGGRTFDKVYPPISVSSRRVAVKYKEDGGDKLDGVVYVRPGVKDLSLGTSRYAQVRIMVDGTHYIKGMAIYKPDLPKGVDLEFNTNKSSTGNKMDALKKVSDDPDNPFTSQIRDQITERHPKTGEVKVTSAMNIVNEEGSWDKWSKSIASQVLSKQSPKLAKTQLDMRFEQRKTELDTILALTNPVVRRSLLKAYSDGVDRDSVKLKAAHLPRQRSQVILPVTGMKETEVYAPNFKHGERVALIRYPHGGTFEIPELTVNNRHPEAKRLLGTDPKDAIGISSKVAERLSGADFDGDSVLVIPQTRGRELKSSPALAGLQGFDPVAEYPKYPGMKVMDAKTKQMQMGRVSNLITDMTIQRASTADLARAVRHSMVVIDAEKHELNWQLSAQQNGIPALMKKYQGRSQGGASTLISRASSQLHVPERIPQHVARGGPVDKVTGKKVFQPTDRVVVTKDGKIIPRRTETTKLAEADDAHTLVSKNGGTVIEKVYAEHANRMKALADEARLAMVHTKNAPYSPSARKVHQEEVDSLTAKLHLAVRNRPLERQAQLVANARIAAQKKANPGMTKEELKKVKYKALQDGRAATGADKATIEITDREWSAIQAGAITSHMLSEILINADTDVVKKLATPRVAPVMTTAKVQRAKAMLALGYTQSEVAEAVGVPLSTLKSGVAREES